MTDLLTDDELSFCEYRKVKVTRPGDADYPKIFEGEEFRPHVLFYWGHPVWNTHDCLSVVGSRDPSHQALDWLEEELRLYLKKRVVAVVSGGARGVDIRAHQLAIRTSRPTVAFLPSGLMHLYPSSLEEWIDPIVAGGGAIISQFSPSARMCKGFFHARNRLIAAISKTTLVIEARRQSGTAMTARYAQNLNRNVAVVPSFPTEAGLAGLDILYEAGGQMIRDHLDLDVFT